MPMGITDEHLALHDAVKGWAERHCPPSVPRALLDEPAESLPIFWADLAAQGWIGIHLDEAFGGEGYGIPELAVVLEELGAAGAPGPFLATTLAGAVLQAAGKEVASVVGARTGRRLGHRRGRRSRPRSTAPRSTAGSRSAAPRARSCPGISHRCSSWTRAAPGSC